MKVGVLSDTHGCYLSAIETFFADCDQLWHAGDIGSQDVYNRLSAFKPLKAVYGNIDDALIRKLTEKELFFEAGGLNILMTHIGGYPPKYNANSLPLIDRYKPDIFVCGHSHILKVVYDQQRKMLAINPGAAGNYGFHKAITMLKFDIVDKTTKNMDVFHQER